MRATGTSLLDAGRMALAGLLVAGCAGGPVVTTLPNDGTAGRVGIPYALPMTVLEVELSVRAPADTVSSKYVATLSLAARRVPDPRAKLLLLREDSAFHEDDVSVGLTDAGLLSSLNVTSSDQGGAVVQAAVRAVLQAIRATAAGTGAEKPPPSDLPEIEGVRRFVRALGHQTQVICLSESWRLVIECARADGGDSTPSSAPAAPDRAVEGVVVRSTEGWIVTASLVHAEGKTFRTDLTTALAVAAPDFCPWTVVPMDRAALVRVEHRATFSDGVLVGARTVRPGTALAVAEAPYEIVQGIVALPTELVQLKIDLTRSQAELEEERRALLEASRLLEEERRRVEGGRPEEPEETDGGR